MVAIGPAPHRYAGRTLADERDKTSRRIEEGQAGKRTSGKREVHPGVAEALIAVVLIAGCARKLTYISAADV